MGVFSYSRGAMALTDTAIKRQRQIEKAYSISDGEGLYLWVTPAGGKLPPNPTHFQTKFNAFRAGAMG